MKSKLVFVLALFAATLALGVPQPQPQQSSCSSYCSRVRCGGDQICGLYTNSQGQQVCGCHPR